MAIVKDVRTRFIIEDVNFIEKTNEFSRTLDRVLEPSLKQIKANFLVFDDRMKNITNNFGKFGRGAKQASTQVRSLADVIFDTGRTLGFTGFVLNVTFERINKMVMGFVKNIISYTTSIGKTSVAVDFLTNTLSKMGQAGLLDTKEKTKEVVDNFNDWYDSSVKLEGALAWLNSELAPFKTVLISVAADGFTAIADAISVIMDKNPDLITEFEAAATTFKDELVTAIVNFIKDLPENMAKIQTLAETLGSFFAGMVDGAGELLDFLDKLSEHIPNLEDLAYNIGKMSVGLEWFGKGLTVLGGPLQTLGMILKGLTAVLGMKALGGLLGGVARTVQGEEAFAIGGGIGAAIAGWGGWAALAGLALPASLIGGALIAADELVKAGSKDIVGGQKGILDLFGDMWDVLGGQQKPWWADNPDEAWWMGEDWKAGQAAKNLAAAQEAATIDYERTYEGGLAPWETKDMTQTITINPEINFNAPISTDLDVMDMLDKMYGAMVDGSYRYGVKYP